MFKSLTCAEITIADLIYSDWFIVLDKLLPNSAPPLTDSIFELDKPDAVTHVGQQLEQLLYKPLVLHVAVA